MDEIVHKKYILASETFEFGPLTPGKVQSWVSILMFILGFFKMSKLVPFSPYTMVLKCAGMDKKVTHFYNAHHD